MVCRRRGALCGRKLRLCSPGGCARIAAGRAVCLQHQFTYAHRRQGTGARRRFGGDEPQRHASRLHGAVVEIKRQRPQQPRRQRAAHRGKAEQKRGRSRDGVADRKPRVHQRQPLHAAILEPGGERYGPHLLRPAECPCAKLYGQIYAGNAPDKQQRGNIEIHRQVIGADILRRTIVCSRKYRA